MTTILILGGYGQTGRALAPLLLAETECRLILAGRHPVMFWRMSRFARRPFGVQLRLEASGTVGGATEALTMNLSHPDGYAFTAIPVVACVRQWLAGTARRPGLWHQAIVVEPVAFVRDLARLGVTVTYGDNDALVAWRARSA